jgi:hypothetical protein
MTSCIGCKFLYGDGSGYSNYTWMETYVRCALHRNPALEDDHEKPFDLTEDPEKDTWAPTMNGRCDHYAAGVFITLDPDREEHPADSSHDREQVLAICKAENLDFRAPEPTVEDAL